LLLGVVADLSRIWPDPDAIVMQLFSLETDTLRLGWSGPAPAPDPTGPTPLLHARALRPGSGVTIRAGADLQRGGHVALPLGVAEQGAYRMLVQGRTDLRLGFRPADPTLEFGLATDERAHIIHGVIDFRGQVGRAVFDVTVGGRLEVTFSVDVVPTKVATSDVEAMRADVDRALAGLALEYLGATTPARPAEDLPVRASWLSLLREALPGLEEALAVIARRPLRDVRRTPEPTRIEAVRRPDVAVRRTLRTRAACGGTAMPPILPARRAVATMDVPEHRRLRSRIETIQRIIAEVGRDEAVLPPTPRRRRTRAELADTAQRLGRLLEIEPLRAAGVGPAPAPTVRTLATPGYAEAHLALQRIESGLAVGAGSVPQATKDLPLLYEMWTYLTVLQMVATILGRSLSPGAFFRGEHVGVRLLLRRGRRHAVAFEDAGRRVEVHYNPRLGTRTGLLAQRPDVLLTISASGEPPRWFVLDAKYRRDDSPAYRHRFGAPGPPADALGDLHRYRDAIVADSGGHRLVEAAVALYPHRPGDAHGETRLWRSIGELGVGAIPVLPGETDWLRRWLTSVLS
jgi:uncharacterized protein